MMSLTASDQAELTGISHPEDIILPKRREVTISSVCEALGQ